MKRHADSTYQIILNMDLQHIPILDYLITSGIIVSTNRYIDGCTIFDVINEHEFFLSVIKYGFEFTELKCYYMNRKKDVC